MLREEMSTAMVKAKAPSNGKAGSQDTVIYNITDELGTTGTKIFSGIINEEYLAEWRTLEQRCKIIDRMLRSDASIRAIYLAMTLPIESADWKIHLEGDMNDQDTFIKEYLERMLFKDMTITWQSFIRQTLTLLPFSFCVKKGKNVILGDGTPKKIEDVKIGDMVIGGSGVVVKVKNTCSREAKEKMYKIKCMGVASDVEVTGNHVIVTTEGEKKARDLKKGDILIQPRMPLKEGGKYNSGWLLGLYLAEGHKHKPGKNSRNNGIVFTLHEKELDLVASRLHEWLEENTATLESVKGMPVSYIMEKIGCSFRTATKLNKREDVGRNRLPRFWVDPVSAGGRVSLSEKNFRLFIDLWVAGSDCYTKHLTQLPTDKEFIRGILDGWVYGDGCQTKNSSIIAGQTSSEKLAYQLQTMAVSLGLPAHMVTSFTPSDSFREIKTGEMKQRWVLKLTPQYMLSQRKDRNILSKKARGCGHSLQSKVCDTYVERKIIDIITEDYTGSVYDLTIDGLPYFLCEGVVIHNSVFEKVFERDEKNQIVKIRKLAPRLQKTVKKWLVDEKGGLAGIEQQAYFAGKDSNVWKTVKIPVDKLVVFTYRQEGSNFEGDGGILRPAYKHWFIKDKLYLIQAIGLERHALGIPVIFLPKGATAEDKAYAKHVVKTWRAHEEAGMLFPEGVKVDTIEGKFQNQALEEAIRHHDMEIGKAVLAQFMQLGSGQSGSWALSKDQSDMFLMTLNSVVKTITDTMNRYVIKPWIDMNFGKRDNYHELTCENITKTSNDEVLKALQTLMSMGLIEKDDDLAEWARTKWSFPAKKPPTPEELQAKQQQEQQAQQQQAQQGQQEQQQGNAGVNAKDGSGSDGAVQAGPAGPGAVGSGGDGGAEMSEYASGNISLSEEDTKEFAETNIAKALLKDSLSKMYDEEAKNSMSKARENAIHKGITDVQIDGIMEFLLKPSVDDLKKKMVGGLCKSIGSVFDHLDSVAPMYRQQQAQSVSRLCDIPIDTLSLMSEGIDSLYSFRDRENDEEEDDTHHKINAMFDGFDKDEGKKVSAFNNAPTFRDPRTGKLKYAKGAIVDGKHVGGTWAHTMHNLGAGVLGTASIAGLTLGGLGLNILRGFTSAAGTELKANFLEKLKTKSFEVITKHPLLDKALLGFWGYGHEGFIRPSAIPSKTLPGNPLLRLVGSTDGTRIGKLKETWLIKDLLTGNNSAKTKILDGADLKGRLSNVFNLRVPSQVEGGNNDNKSPSWSQDMCIDVFKSMPNPLNPANITKVSCNLDFRNTLLSQIVKSTNHPNWRMDDWPEGGEAMWRGKTIGNLLATFDDNTNDLTSPVYSGAINMSNIKFVPRDNTTGELPQTMPTTVGQHIGLSEADTQKKWAAGLVDGRTKGSATVPHPTSEGNHATIVGYQHKGDLSKTLVGVVALGTAGYIFSRIWRGMSNNAIGHVKNYAESLTSGEMSPREMQQYSAHLEQQRRAASPTGGMPGRPRQKPVIPTHLKRAPGRPPAADDPKEIERKRNIDDIVKRWEAERAGGV